MTTLLGLAQVLVVLAVFWVPGFVVLWAAGLRGWLRLAAVAPAATIGVFFACSLVAAGVDVRWNLATALACAAVVAAIAYGLRRVLIPRGRQEEGVPLRAALSSNRTLSAVIGAAVLTQLVPVWSPILRREQVANLPDVMFHLNAIQYIRREGVADPFFLAHMLDPTGATTLYPSGWHSVAGVVPVVLDNTSQLAAATFVVIAVAWACGLAALAREVNVTTHRWVPVLAAAMSVSGLAYPLGVALEPGIIPNAVGLAVAPGAAALIVAALRERRLFARSPYLGTLVLVLLGVGACHPGVLAGLAVLVLPWLIAAALNWWRSVGTAPRIGSAVVVVVLLAAVGYVVATDSLVARIRGLSSELAIPLGDALRGLALGQTAESKTFALVPTVAALLAIAVRLRRRLDLRPVASLALLAATYLLAATGVRWARPFTGLFYVEGRRVAPLVTVLTVVLAAEGLARASRWLVDHVRIPDRMSGVTAAGLVSGLLIGISALLPTYTLVVSTDPAVYKNTLEPRVTATSIVPYFMREELAMVDRLPMELPTDAVLLGAPSSGVSYVYGLTGIRTLPFARGLAKDLDAAAVRVADIATDPTVCETLRKYGVTHIYKDPALLKGATWPIPRDPIPDLEEPSFRLVEAGGTARVYEITACR